MAKNVNITPLHDRVIVEPAFGSQINSGQKSCYRKRTVSEMLYKCRRTMEFYRAGW